MDGVNALKMCEEDDRMYEQFISRNERESELSGKTLDQQGSEVLMQMRHDYMLQIEVCVLKKLKENTDAAAAISSRECGPRGNLGACPQRTPRAF